MHYQRSESEVLIDFDYDVVYFFDADMMLSHEGHRNQRLFNKRYDFEDDYNLTNRNVI